MTTSALIGREPELRILTEIVEQTHERGNALAIRGDAGIGKSVLLQATVDHARRLGLQVLRTTGVESEAGLPFSGLHFLLRPLLGNVGSLPAVQREALRAALGSESAAPPEPFLVALSALNLLTEASLRGPLLVAIDDIQWLDPPTHDALAFMARRVEDDPIFVLAAIRNGHHGPFLEAGLPELEVRGLDDASARQVVIASAGDLSYSDREQILDAAQGNPLALVELPVAWRDASLPTRAAYVPLTSRLERAFGARIAELSVHSRDALLVAAVASVDNVAEVLAAASVIAGEVLGVEVLDRAREAGLVQLDEMRLWFRHPLVRSGVLQSEPVARRQAAHAALAEVIVDEPYRRTWHRAHAIVGPDDAVADELEASHLIALARGSATSAIWALERSAQLTTDPAQRGRRLLVAAEHAFGLGRADMVDRLLAAASRGPLSDLERARMEWLREIFNDGVPGDATRVLGLCEVARQAIAADDTDLALNLLLGAALRCWWADTGPAARRRVVEVAHELHGVEADSRYIATLAVAEPVLQGRAVLDLLSGVTIEEVTDADALRLLGMAAHAVGDQARSAEFLDRSETRLRVQGRLGLLPHVLGMRASVGFDIGDWDKASAAAEEGKRVAKETGQPIWSVGQLVNDAKSAALRGDSERALELAAQAEHAPEIRNLNCFRACALVAKGIALTSARQFPQAYESLRRLFDERDPSFHQKERFSAVMFLAEAAVHSHESEDACRILAELEEVAQTTPSPTLHLHMDYARATLADDADAERLFLVALGRDLTRWPWLKARIELAFGTWLRRQRRVAESRAPLRSAQITFDVIGATSWAEQARIELRAAGERAPVRANPAQDALSPQELQIAHLAAEGFSNREIGERLFLSHRTVGSHLYRIFPKLDNTSRGQLAARLDLVGRAIDPAPH